MARILILTGSEKFTSAGLTLPTGVAAIILRGQSFQVDDELAETLLTSGDYVRFDGDDNAFQIFEAAPEDTAPDYDFTAPKVELNPVTGTPDSTTTHSEDGLDKVAKIDNAAKAEKGNAITRTNQRARATGK